MPFGFPPERAFSFTGIPTTATKEVALPHGDDAPEAKALHFVCDEPSAGDERPRNRTLVVRGWALGEDPLEYIEVAIPDLAPLAIPIRTPGPMLNTIFPISIRTAVVGFSGMIDTQPLSNGNHTAHVRLIANSKVLREIETGFLIDHTVGYASDYANGLPNSKLLQMRFYS